MPGSPFVNPRMRISKSRRGGTGPSRLRHSGMTPPGKFSSVNSGTLSACCRWRRAHSIAVGLTAARMHDRALGRKLEAKAIAHLDSVSTRRCTLVWQRAMGSCRVAMFDLSIRLSLSRSDFAGVRIPGDLSARGGNHHRACPSAFWH